MVAGSGDWLFNVVYIVVTALTKPFRIGRQEDAHEFLRYYVDSMQKSCLKSYPSKYVI